MTLLPHRKSKNQTTDLSLLLNLLIETDWEGVTIYTKMIDVVVVAPTREAITDLIAGCEWKERLSTCLLLRAGTDGAPF